MMGPTPKKKNDRPAIQALGQNRLATMVNDANTDTMGPTRIATPKVTDANRRGASKAPSTMPVP